MNQHSCYKHELEQAMSAGFNQHFCFFPCGSIFSISASKKYFDEEISITVKAFVEFRFSFYYIITVDGARGTAVEYWDV